ncbi:MAG: hypothetical protein ABI690_24160 [Chloroflexota bacterium]
MSEQNFSVERDLKELQTMAAALVPYVYEDELYGRVGMNMPSLTVGAVLLRLHRLRALASRLTPEQLSILEQAEAEMQTVRREWTSHFEKKLTREAEARMRDILTYLREAKESPRTGDNGYLLEAVRRTIVQELLDAMPDDARKSEIVKAAEVDSGLRRSVFDSDFIWTKDLEPVYPAETYWWLYKRPHQPSGKADAR